MRALSRATLVVVLFAAGCGDAGASVPSTEDADAGAEVAGDAIVGGDQTDAEADAADDGDSGADAGDPRAAELHARADAALEALMLAFWSGDAQYFTSTPGAATTTGYWIHAQAFDVVLDGVERSKGRRFAGLVETMFLAQEARGWKSDYFDDESWMALALVRAFDLTGDTRYLDRGKQLLDDIIANWDTTCCGKVPGGVWWNRAHTQKATASNVGPAMLAVRVAKRTKTPSYLSFARKVLDYWATAMIDPSTHQVADHITPDGIVTRWKFTYNEGLTIGAAFELWQATGDAKYRALAKDTADFMVAHESKASATGPVLSDGASGACSGDCAQFKGIGFRYLAELWDDDRSVSAYGAVLEGSAASIWKTAREPKSTLFAVDWLGPFAAPALLEAQTSAAMALARHAALVGARPDDSIASTYEAEEAVLHHLGLEATHAGFGGFGYVAGWHADGQWVDFHVDAPKAGAYTLHMRYAAGAGVAARHVFVEGKTAIASHDYPSTGAWDNYQTSDAKISLAVGANTVSLIYDSTRGSHGYLNLDRISLEPAP